MKQKLILLNLVLLVVSGLFGAELYQSWKSARERERATLNKRVAPGPTLAVVVGLGRATLSGMAAKDQRPNRNKLAIAFHVRPCWRLGGGRSLVVAHGADLAERSKRWTLGRVQPGRANTSYRLGPTANG